MSRDGWHFLDTIAEKYGTVVKLQAFLGVSPRSFYSFFTEN